MPGDARRLWLCLGLLVATLGGESLYRRWSPREVFATEHYRIRSSATPDQTREVARAIEALHTAYLAFFADVPRVRQPHPPLAVDLYRDRSQYRRCVRHVGWTEAMYRRPCCHGYYAAQTPSAHHWMVHEAAHQMNDLVAGWRLSQWLEEGLALHFSTCRLTKEGLDPAWVDLNTYPIWWLDAQDLSGDLDRDIREQRIIPLRVLISGKGGPSLNREFNLYYVHWWSLVRFLVEHNQGQYRPALQRVIAAGGSLESFEANIGPVTAIEPLWYRYLQEEIRWARNPALRLQRPPPAPSDGAVGG